ncbi:immunoglobulin-like domain-containing protein [Aliivibrio logei]|uniref:immunoglobulin-like domain-containing protein n=1 Tax=Aliivibrio logei TaxID=688 RepID=UPI0035C89A03
MALLTNKMKLNTIALALLGAGFSVQANDMTNPDGGVVVGYWHNWCDGRGYQGGNAPCMALKETNPMYNVVDISFMKVYDTSEGRIPTFRLDPTVGLSEAEFIEQIQELNTQGRSVLIALGGADAHIELKRGDEIPFADEIIRLVELYGFDGLDIDLEQAAVTAADNQWVIPEALKIVKDHYRSQGKNFLITMAPEFPYLKTGDKYVPYLERLEGYYDWINPQFYNQGGDGIWVDEENAWITQNSDTMKEKFIYYISDSLINGTRGFHKIPHDKLVFGIPTNNDAAATGFVKEPQDLYNAFDALKQQGQPLRGVMTWSINWDIGTDSVGTPYNSSFINAYGPYIHSQTPPPPVVGKPVFTGLTDTRVPHGTVFDSLAGVTAMDKEDGNLTSSITVEGSVNTQVLGDNVLAYSVTDSDGNETKQARNIEVYSALPELIGVANTTIKIGSDFNPRTDVKATDAEDGDLTSQISIEGTVNTSLAGKYTLTYSVTDSANQTTTAQRTITVNDGSQVCVNPWKADQVYLTDETVSHNGKTWQAGWWTQGDEPGATGEWGVWKQIGDNDCGGVTPEPGIELTAKITDLSNEYSIANSTANVTFSITTNNTASVTVDIIDRMGNSIASESTSITGIQAVSLTLNNVEAGYYSMRLLASNADDSVEERYSFNLVSEDTPTPPPTDIPVYEVGKTYADGEQVLGSDGNIYQCKPWPYTPWCSSASYAPAESQYWADAWDKV